MTCSVISDSWQSISYTLNFLWGGRLLSTESETTPHWDIHLFPVPLLQHSITLLSAQTRWEQVLALSLSAENMGGDIFWMDAQICSDLWPYLLPIPCLRYLGRGGIPRSFARITPEYPLALSCVQAQWTPDGKNGHGYFLKNPSPGRRMKLLPGLRILFHSSGVESGSSGDGARGRGKIREHLGRDWQHAR